MEIWKDVKGYEGLYQVSDLGNVKSLNYRRMGLEKLLKQSSDGRGYFFVSLFKNGKKHNGRVHKLVANTFLNHIPDGLNIVVDHIDNNQLNNKLDNLQLISYRLNLSKDKKGTSKYTGVSWDKYKKRWISRITISKQLGSFKNEIDAHNAYQKALIVIKQLN